MQMHTFMVRRRLARERIPVFDFSIWVYLCGCQGEWYKWLESRVCCVNTASIGLIGRKEECQQTME